VNKSIAKLSLCSGFLALNNTFFPINAVKKRSCCRYLIQYPIRAFKEVAILICQPRKSRGIRGLLEF